GQDGASSSLRSSDSAHIVHEPPWFVLRTRWGLTRGGADFQASSTPAPHTAAWGQGDKRMKRTILALGAIGLALALAGGAWAGKRYLITSSSQVKNGALTGADIQNHSLDLADLASGTVHALHAAGRQGP